MKNLMTYTPEPFENLEIMDAEYDVLTGEREMEEGEIRRRKRQRSARATVSHMGRPRFPHRRPKYPAQTAPSSSGGGASSVDKAAMPPDNDSSFGQYSSERVRWAQDCLNRILDLRLIVDGIMNRETRSALREFQRRNRLAVTGFMGPDTEEALKAACQQAAEPELYEEIKKNATELQYKKMSDFELFKRVADNGDENASTIIRQRYPSNAAALQKILGSDYRPPHSATAVLKRKGMPVWRKSLDSGRMTLSERALGFPNSMFATHTESRVVRQAPLRKGDILEIIGQYNPCRSCQRAMQKAATHTGSTIRYWWQGGEKIFRP